GATFCICAAKAACGVRSDPSSACARRPTHSACHGGLGCGAACLKRPRCEAPKQGDLGRSSRGGPREAASEKRPHGRPHPRPPKRAEASASGGAGEGFKLMTYDAHAKRCQGGEGTGGL